MKEMLPVSGKELEESLATAGKSLLQPPSSVDELLSLLDRIEELLSKVEQSPAKSMQNALSPLMKALVLEKLLKHSDADVKVGVASCISEITRITAPEAPYDDDTMKDVFQLIVSTFENLPDTSSRSHVKRATMLEIVAKVRSCVIMLDLECDQMIIEMFQHFLTAIRDYHNEVIFASMETIMSLVLEESEDISSDLLSPILATLKKGDEAVLPVAKKLAARVIQNTADKIRPYLTQAVKSLDASFDDFSEVVSSLCGENTGTDGHSNECSSKDQLVANDGIGETDSKDEGPAVVGSPELIVRNGINEIGTEETTDANSLKMDDSNHQPEAKALTDMVLDDNVAKKSVNSEEKPENAEVQQVSCEHEIPGKDECISATEVKPVEVAKSLDEAREIQLSQSEPPENEGVEVACPTQTVSLPDDSELKEDSLEKRKNNLIRGERVSVDTASDKASEGEYASGAKKQRRSGKKQADKRANMSRTLTDKGTPNNDDGSASDSVAKSLDRTENLGNASDKMEDASSLRKEDGKKSGRVKPSLEKDVSKSSAREERRKDAVTSLKATRDQGIQEETTRANTKRKRAPSTEKASETVEYGENLVGSKVKVYWPQDRMYYEGVIDSFDSVKKKHKVLYIDGDEEVLNLRKQRWEFLTNDVVSEGEQDGENSKHEASFDMKTKKKGNTNSEPLSRRSKMDGSSKSKVKGSATKSGGKSSKYDSHAESESKHNSKSGRRSGDDTVKDHSQKPRGKAQSDPAAKTSSGSKDKERDKDNAAEKTPGHSKQVSQKPAKSKGKKTPRSGKTAAAGGRMEKSSSSKVKASGDEMKEKTTDSEKLPEIAKGKSADIAKSRESEAKSGGKKRRKSNI